MQRNRPGTAFLQQEVEATKSKIKTGQIIQPTVSSAVASSIVITILHFSCLFVRFPMFDMFGLKTWSSRVILIWCDSRIWYRTCEPSRGKASPKFLANSVWPISLSRICAEMESAVFVQKKHQKTIRFPICPKKTWDFIVQTGVERVTLTMCFARFATNCWFSNMSSRNSKGDTDTQIPPFDISDICPAWDRSGLSSRNGPLWLLTLVCSCPIWHHFFSFISLALIALHNLKSTLRLVPRNCTIGFSWLTVGPFALTLGANPENKLKHSCLSSRCAQSWDNSEEIWTWNMSMQHCSAWQKLPLWGY